MNLIFKFVLLNYFKKFINFPINLCLFLNLSMNFIFEYFD